MGFLCYFRSMVFTYVKSYLLHVLILVWRKRVGKMSGGRAREWMRFGDKDLDRW